MNTRTVQIDTAKKILDNITCRKGFDAVWDMCDRGIQQEILEAIAGILAAAPPQPEPKVYQCPRCATSMEVDPTAKPTNAAPPQSEPLRCNLTGMKGCAYPKSTAPEQAGLDTPGKSDAQPESLRHETAPVAAPDAILRISSDENTITYRGTPYFKGGVASSKSPERRVAQRRVESERDTERPLPARRQGWKTDRRQNAAGQEAVRSDWNDKWPKSAPAAPASTLPYSYDKDRGKCSDHATRAQDHQSEGETREIESSAVPAAAPASTLPLSAEQIDVFNRDGCTDEEFRSVCTQALRAIDLDAKCRMVFEQHDGTKLSAYELCNLKLRVVELERQVAENDVEIKRLRASLGHYSSLYLKVEAELAELKARVK